jgi:hypothetical protein
VKTALYRHFDADGLLLYVGISLHSIQRTMQHKLGARWFEQIAQIAIEWHPSREAALACEAIAIARENPAFNVQRPLKLVEQPKPAKAKPEPRKVRGLLYGFTLKDKESWGVFHPASGAADGWYTDKQEALHMVGWFGAVFPGERFELVACSRHAPFQVSRWRKHNGRKPVDLRSNNWERWCATAPDYSAGDLYDRQAA